MSPRTICTGTQSHERHRAYHDTEWGTPVHDDRLLFEFLILEGAQAGLSWLTILKKRDGFDATKIARYTDKKRATLLADASIVRNRAEIDAAIRNAKAFLAVQEERGSFDPYIWQFTGGQPIVNRWKSRAPVAQPRGLRSPSR